MNDNFLIKRGHFTPLAILLMILLPLVTALICICLGRMNVPVGDVIAVFRDVLTGNEGHAQNYSIVINLRLPRILMAIIVGAGLTCAGDLAKLGYDVTIFEALHKAVIRCNPVQSGKSPVSCRIFVSPTERENVLPFGENKILNYGNSNCGALQAQKTNWR